MNCIALVYGEKNNEIRYAEFLKDCNVLKFEIYKPTSGAKSTYEKKFTDFNGESEFT